MEKKLKFCMITTFFPPFNFGGDGIMVQRLSEALARRGHQVHVIHCVDAYHTLEPKVPAQDVSLHKNITVHRLKSPLGFLSPLLTHQTGQPFGKAASIKKILEENDFDVIHFHNISLVGGPGVLSYGKAVKLYTTHEHWLICPLSVLWKFDKTACDKQACVRCTIHGRRPPQLWRHTKTYPEQLKHVDAFISPSRFTIDKHIQMGFDLPFTHIPHFLPMPAKDESAGWRAAHPRPYFLYAGRLEKNKGAHIPVKAFRDFAKADLLIAGDGSFRRELERQADGLSHIKFLGRQDHARLRQLYRGAVGVIVPSLCYETFGVTALEAFAERTPVIVNNLGALPEIVEESQGGFVYNNETELRRAVEVLLSDQSRRDSLGENGYTCYQNNWTEEIHIQRYMGLIARLKPAKEVTAWKPQPVEEGRL